ncbi:pyridoxamine 5'-phosphate oxidase [Bacillus sp. HMF5848]|uniref:pyridoxamine 5'-phosphate oxidase family protein n=1 Tax=Bacillus sp. HMF5848 TaxID=2495421 RepID=UPI000F76F908|nr:pyridoxamine 5'-phosphate oxidase family protein [Bacillus sp. HMF5848]RSK27232.1 pyridoxamine 5'-phosphate oxidase [Bacillus sp. HMF5848]
MANTESSLSKELIDVLQGEKIVALITLDEKTREPHLSAVSWLKAHSDGKTIKFALGHKGTSVTNIQANPEVTFGVIGAGGYYSIKGKATISDVIEKSMKYRVATVNIEEVENVIFYGGKITVEPEYEKTYGEELAKKLDQEVYDLLSD